MKKLFFIGLSVLALSTAVTITTADELEEVIVTSSLIDAAASDISNPLHILDAKSLTKDANQSIGSMIDSLSGVSSSDFGAAVGQPIIRGLSGSRVKLLNNGKVVRDISSLGPDHSNEIDLGHLQQIEIVRGPSSLLYANGAVGGIVNIVDNTIAKQDIDALTFNLGAGYEDGNTGNTGNASFAGNIGGVNVTSSIQYANLGNYAIPEHALHDDDHADEDDHGDDDHGDDDHGDDDHGDHDAEKLENSDFAKFGAKLGFSKVGDWGYVGLSYADSSSTYGIPFHGDDHGEDDHGEDDHGEDDHGEDDHGEDDHGDEDHADEDHADHEGERIFADTNSETINFEGAFNFDGGLVKRADYYIRRTSYDLTEQHADEHGDHDDHGEDDHGEDDHGEDDHGEDDHGDDEHGEDDHGDDDHGDDHGDEHHDEGTLFKNDSKEFGITLDISQNSTIQKLTLNVAEENFSITGHEAFLKPTQSDEITLGYFTSNEFDLVHVDFGLRYDQIERETTDGTYEAELTSYSTTISGDLTDGLGVSFGVSSVQKAPSAMELFVDGPHLITQRFEKGNVTLEPEEANNIDLAFNTVIAGFDADLSLYKNSISNYIYLQDTAAELEELTVSEYRQNDAVFKGYELEFSRSIALENGNLKLSIARDYVDAQFKQGGYIPRSVPTRNIVNLSYSGNNDLDLLLSIKDVQKQSKVATNEEATDGFQWVNFSLNRDIKTSDSEVLTVSFFAKNLLNKVARNHSSFVKEEVPLPGRNLGLKLNYSF